MPCQTRSNRALVYERRVWIPVVEKFSHAPINPLSKEYTMRVYEAAREIYACLKNQYPEEKSFVIVLRDSESNKELAYRESFMSSELVTVPKPAKKIRSSKKAVPAKPAASPGLEKIRSSKTVSAKPITLTDRVRQIYDNNIPAHTITRSITVAGDDGNRHCFMVNPVCSIASPCAQNPIEAAAQLVSQREYKKALEIYRAADNRVGIQSITSFFSPLVCKKPYTDATRYLDASHLYSWGKFSNALRLLEKISKPESYVKDLMARCNVVLNNKATAASLSSIAYNALPLPPKSWLAASNIDIHYPAIISQYQAEYIMRHALMMRDEALFLKGYQACVAADKPVWKAVARDFGEWSV
jgi:hypothetical protein